SEGRGIPMTVPEPNTSEHAWSEEPTPVCPDDLSEGTWELLREEERRAMTKAYVSDSASPVGAAGLVDDGRIVGGCKPADALCGVTLCAGGALVSDLFMSGGGRLVAFDCVDGDGNTLVPCGRCRQLLFEHGGDDLILNMPGGRSPMSVVLPEAFGPDHLSQARDAHSAKH